MSHNFDAGFVYVSGTCSWCRREFRQGAARFIHGEFPLAYFCSYRCADIYGKRVMHGDSTTSLRDPTNMKDAFGAP